MRALTVKACAKVNLSLFITGQRPDGYHLLDMVMQSVSLCDCLLLEEDGPITLQGDTAGATGMDNLAMRAACLLARESGLKAGCRITLKKRIPAQAGMGGGSADAAAVLLGLNQLWGARAQPDQLASLALRLGADVPFFLQGGTARAQGIGEQLYPVADFPQLELVIVKPDQGLATPAVFRYWHSCGREQPSRIEAYLDAMASRGPSPLWSAACYDDRQRDGSAGVVCERSGSRAGGSRASMRRLACLACAQSKAGH